MITLRMVAIAVAILVSIPVGLALADHAIGHYTVPGGELVNYGLDGAAQITDVVLLEGPETYDRIAIHNAPEQLVEGHTVFVTWDIPLVRNVTNWTVDIVGNVSCQDHINAEGQFFAGLPIIPRRINDAYVECRAAGRVFATPDPFYNSSDTTGYDPGSTMRTELVPTGKYVSFTAPSGDRGVATEYVYEVIRTTWLGEQTATTVYAWAVPIVDPWTHQDGRERNWFMPIPALRLIEMGLTQFNVYHEDDLDEAGLFLAE